MTCVDVFYVTKNQISVGSDDRKCEIAHRPHRKKIANFGNAMSINMMLLNLAILEITKHLLG